MKPEEALDNLLRVATDNGAYSEPDGTDDLREALQVLADVRTLDEYAEATGFRPSAPYKVGATWYLRIPTRTPTGVKDMFAEGATSDEARSLAAACLRSDA